MIQVTVRLFLVPIVVVLALGCGHEPPRSILLIVVDTLRADRLDCYGYDRSTSPAIDALAESGTLFERAQSTSSWTVPSVASLLTGQTPSRHGAGRVLRSAGKIVLRNRAKVFYRIDESVRSVAMDLKQRGYATAAIVSNPFLAPAMGLDRGFDQYSLMPEAPASAVTEAARSWLAAADERPFFLWVHYMDPHTPYAPPANVARRFVDLSVRKLPVVADDVWHRLHTLTAAERRFISGAYDAQIVGVDSNIGLLIRSVRKLRPNALVVLTADHGEELFDHGGFEHGHSLHAEVMHVPLIAAGPGVRHGRISTPVSLVDVAPTLLEAAGLRPRPSAGSSLWPLLRGDAGAQPSRSQVAEGTLYGHDQQALLRWPYKLIAEDADPQITYRLYDLEADPRETRDLAPQQPDRVEDLSRQLAASRTRASKSRVADVEVRMYQLPVDELDALGYLELH